MSVIDKARSDSRLASLLKDIQQQRKLRFEKSNSSDWLSSLDDERAVIEYAGCRHPSAALAQELLLLDLQLRGYRPIRLGISSSFDQDAMPTFINVLNHELQRHKIYDRFIALGFTPEQFYRDADKDTSPYLNQVLMTEPDTITRIIPPFMMLLAPGGTLSLNAFQDFYDRFLRINPKWTKQLLTIEQLFKDWAVAETVDQTETVRKIMLTIEPKGNFSWFGFKDEHGFPDNGFFVDEAFSVRVLPNA
ncbi:MAG: hypothetical protein REI95_08915 [Oxalicibacterium faecigallinarum]|uniref:Uncharacterized protein n=1 Tax=Oxalicibacterium faecigallinarum TaxID=573741 RepID=A0A8J3AZF8_9BURK|nr:hypothetical protein [Oxalicibacterium faecigallinarum]MDQ7969748.1 hypothetical protein [Oxalicibacterium faecigallinarum]GGI20526.1 hypothetical protein GCM10008066_24470 [Oxalicibacterium faecigallinarum]